MTIRDCSQADKRTICRRSQWSNGTWAACSHPLGFVQDAGDPVMSHIFRLPSTLGLALVCIVSAVGCATTPYHYGQLASGRDPSETVEIVRGETSPFLSRLTYIIETPTRILPFHRAQTRHQLSSSTEETLTGYLQNNHLQDVHVCVNEYDPIAEWQRLKGNRTVGPGWRYSLGLLSLARYTLLPDPVFAVNQYNPYTNRLSINRDEPVGLLYEAAYSKDVHAQVLPGTYAAMSMFPGLSLAREVRGISDVVGYARVQEDWELEKGAYRSLYPRAGAGSMMIGVFVLPLWWEQLLLGAGSSATGYLAGRIVESRREKEMLAAKQTPSVPMDSPKPIDRPMPTSVAVQQIPNWEFIEDASSPPEIRQAGEP